MTIKKKLRKFLEKLAGELTLSSLMIAIRQGKKSPLNLQNYLVYRDNSLKY